MASVAVHTKAVLLLLIIHCLFQLPLFRVRSLFCYAVLCVHSSFAIILLGEKDNWLLYLYGLIDFMWLLLFFASFSWCRRYRWTVCSV